MSHKIAKELEALDKLEKEWQEKMKQEEEKEEEIIRLRDVITDKLMNSSKIRISAFDKIFELAIVVNANIKPARAKLIVVDKARFEIAGSKYKPLQIDAEFDDNYTIKGNLVATVEAWLRHITGTIKPEMIEEETDEVKLIKEK